jgi:hypothetical protein
MDDAIAKAESAGFAIEPEQALAGEQRSWTMPHIINLIGRGIGCTRRLMHKFVGARSASASVEFAMVGTVFVFILTLFSMSGMYYYKITMLDLAVQTVSRNILVGNIISQNQFVADVKAASNGILQGQTIYVAAQAGSSFASLSPITNVSTGGTGGALPYNTGTYGSDILIQVGYTDTTLSYILPKFITSVISTIAFQREPSPT